MNIKKCDRCGKYYDREKNTTVTVGLNSTNSVVELLSYYYGENYDLCEECAEEFKAWMNIDEKKTIEEPHGTE